MKTTADDKRAKFEHAAELARVRVRLCRALFLRAIARHIAVAAVRRAIIVTARQLYGIEAADAIAKALAKDLPA